MSRKRRYSDEFRLKIVKEYMSRRSGGTKMLGKKYCIHPSTILRWVHLYENHGRNGLTGGTGSYSGDFAYKVFRRFRNGSEYITKRAKKRFLKNDEDVIVWAKRNR